MVMLWPIVIQGHLCSDTIWCKCSECLKRWRQILPPTPDHTHTPTSHISRTVSWWLLLLFWCWSQRKTTILAFVVCSRAAKIWIWHFCFDSPWFLWILYELHLNGISCAATTSAMEMSGCVCIGAICIQNEDDGCGCVCAWYLLS